MANTTTAAPAGDDDTPRKARKRAARNPTRNYQPGQSGMWWGYPSAALDGVPFFTWFDIPRMLRDPRVRFAERMWRSPFQQVKWAVKAEHPKVAAFVGTTLRRFWRRALPKLLSRYFRYGYAPGGAEFVERKGVMRLDTVRAVEPLDARPRVWTVGPNRGQPAGFTISLGGALGLPDAGNTWVGSPHAFWFAGYGEYGHFYDMPPMSGMFVPWLEKNGRTGALHARRLWYRKCAFSGGTLYHPPGTVNMGTDENPRIMDAQDVARSTLEYSEAGDVKTFTNELNGNTGQYAWDYKEPTSRPDVKGVLDYPKDLDGEMLQGIGIVPEILEAASTGSGWSGRAFPMVAFLGGVDELAGLLLEAADAGFVRHAVAINFGRQSWYEIEPVSLAAGLLQETKSGPGGGEGQNPIAGMFGLPGPKQEPTPTPTNMSDGRGDVWDAAVRRAKRKARGRRRHARELSWVPHGTSQGGQNRWLNPDTNEVRYQDEKPSDGKGAGDVPGDAAAIHAAADAKATGILAAAVRVPKHLLGKVRDKVKGTYGKLSTRYGPRYAKAIVAAGLTGLPIPLPGASVMMAAPVIAVAELHRLLAKGGDRDGTVDPAVVKPAAQWFVGRVLGKARTALHLSWVNLSDDRAGDGEHQDIQDAAGKLLRERKKDLVRLIAVAMLKAQERASAAGQPQRAAPYLEQLGDLAADPDQVAGVVGEKLLSWSPYEGSRGGHGWKNDETGRIVYGTTKPGEKREKQKASGAKARTILAAVGTGEATPEHVAELADHLPALTVKQLRTARQALAASWGGSRLKREGMVNALLNHVRGKVQEMRANAGKPPEGPKPGPAAKAPRAKATGTLADGTTVRFVPHKSAGKRDATVLLDPKKVEAAWSQDAGYHIPPGGGGAEVPGRTARFKTFLATGRPIQAPRLVIGSHGRMNFEDGRHRFAVLRDAGIDRVAATVPKAQAEQFKKQYGLGAAPPPPPEVPAPQPTPPPAEGAPKEEPPKMPTVDTTEKELRAELEKDKTPNGKTEEARHAEVQPLLDRIRATHTPDEIRDLSQRITGETRGRTVDDWLNNIKADLTAVTRLVNSQNV